MATQETARPQSGGAFLTFILIIVIAGLAVIASLMFYQQNQDRVIFYAQQTAKAATTEPTQPARPTPPPAATQATIMVQTVPEGAAPQNVAQQPAQRVVPAESSAPIVAPAPRPIVIVVHEGGGSPRITGSGACDVAAKGARRCAK